MLKKWHERNFSKVCFTVPTFLIWGNLDDKFAMDSLLVFDPIARDWSSIFKPVFLRQQIPFPQKQSSM